MNDLKVLSLFAILVASTGTMPAFAQSADITVATDKGAYEDGEAVMVSGQVKDVFSGLPVSLRVFAPNGNIVTIEQIDISSDKTFSVEITAGGDLWRSAGTYTIEVSYGLTTQKTATTTFEFAGSSGAGRQFSTIAVEGEDYIVRYMITGGRVLSITPNYAATSLEIAIDATSDGQLTIILPRALIDALLPTGGDDVFFVLVDGEERDFDETETTAMERTLAIPFEKGAEEIEIIGTFIIPEFGAVAALILAVAIISIIAVSARSRLSILPRY